MCSLRSALWCTILQEETIQHATPRLIIHIVTNNAVNVSCFVSQCLFTEEQAFKNHAVNFSIVVLYICTVSMMLPMFCMLVAWIFVVVYGMLVALVCNDVQANKQRYESLFGFTHLSG